MKNRSKCSVRVALRLARTKPDIRFRRRRVRDRRAARLGDRRGVEYTGPSRESGVWSVAGRARYVFGGRLGLVINEKFSQQLHLMCQVLRRRGWDFLKQRRFSEVDERVQKL